MYYCKHLRVYNDRFKKTNCMWRQLIILALIFGSVLKMQAQDLKEPVTKDIKLLDNGWHKFSSGGAIFDVEILEGNLVKGKVIWFDNTTYSGTFLRNRIGGRGTYTWPNGNRYEGGVKNNQRHGKGTMYWKDGTKYTGKWKNNLRHGKGQSFDTDGSLVQQGIWVNNVFSESK